MSTTLVCHFIWMIRPSFNKAKLTKTPVSFLKYIIVHFLWSYCIYEVYRYKNKINLNEMTSQVNHGVQKCAMQISPTRWCYRSDVLKRLWYFDIIQIVFKGLSQIECLWLKLVLIVLVQYKLWNQCIALAYK